jgi:hypothetical protein
MRQIILAREAMMRTSHRKGKILLLGFLASLSGAALAQEPNEASTLPVFSSTLDTAWVGIGIGAFFEVPGSPTPIVQDPIYPYVSNGRANRTGEQATHRMGDISNPNLKEWAREEMRAENERVINGKFAYTSRTACRSAGVPGFDVTLSGALFIHQSRDKVTLIFDGNAETRHIWLNVGHSDNLRPTGYGESVGHYEGDTLVVDTIGLNDDTYIDNWRTPHSDRLHVTERWRLIEDGAKLEIMITIEDPETFNEPWQAQRLYDHVSVNFEEDICAESVREDVVEYGIPIAQRLDF